MMPVTAKVAKSMAMRRETRWRFTGLKIKFVRGMMAKKGPPITSRNEYREAIPRCHKNQAYRLLLAFTQQTHDGFSRTLSKVYQSNFYDY